MKTLDNSNIKALISLLEDPSEDIFNHVNKSILELGVHAILPLQNAYNESEDALQKERIVAILDGLKLQKLDKDLSNWSTNNSTDLFAGLLLIAQYGYPALDVSVINKTIKAMVDAIKPKLKDKTPTEIAHVFNQTILYDFGFNGNIKNYSGINNSFINKIIENKISNPIGLSILYLLVAKQLNIPLVGVNSPGHFIVGYADESYTFNDIIDGTIIDKIDFYIDPFKNGSILTQSEFDAVLVSIPYKLEDKKLLAASNISIIKRVMNNLIYALFTTGEKSTAKELLAINESI